MAEEAGLVKQLLLLPWRTLAFAALALAAAATPGAPSALGLAREPLLAGELWRLWTAHLAHGSAYHLGWNLAALVALGLLFEYPLKQRIWSLMFVSFSVVGLGLVLLDSRLWIYCGLSGVLNGLWVGGALFAARSEYRRRHFAVACLYRVCVVGGLAKIAVEAWTGVPLLTDASALGGTPVPLAHALGALGGVIWLAVGPALETKVAPLAHSRPVVASAVGFVRLMVVAARSAFQDRFWVSGPGDEPAANPTPGSQGLQPGVRVHR